MAGIRKHGSSAFNAMVALEAANQTQPIAELAEVYRVHPVHITR